MIFFQARKSLTKPLVLISFVVTIIAVSATEDLFQHVRVSFVTLDVHSKFPLDSSETTCNHSEL